MKQTFNHFRKEFGNKLDSLAVKAFPLIIKPFSRFFRQLFEFKHIGRALGILVILSVLSMAVLPVSLAAVQTNIETNEAEVQAIEGEIKTEKSIRLPLESFAITQGFRLLHPGIDMAATKGMPVYPVMEGYVEEIQTDHWGYGNHVYINHGNGYRSLYAHLAKIEVKQNEFVNRDSIVGLVGSSGWSTGPHLHFQLWQGDKLVNPRAFFEGYFGKALVSTK